MSGVAASWPRECARTKCRDFSTGVVGIALYRVGKPEEPATRVLLGLHLCEAHLIEAIERGPGSFVGVESLAIFAKLAEQSLHCSIDREATRVVRVDYTDAEFLAYDRLNKTLAH